MSKFIDGVYAGSTLIQTAAAIFSYLVVVLLRSGMDTLTNIRLASLGQAVTDEYRQDIMEHYLSLSASDLSKISSGEIATRLDEDVQGLFRYYYVVIYKLAGSGLTLVIVLAALCARSMWLCAALLLVSIIAIAWYKRIQDKGIQKYVRAATAAAKFNGIIKELLDSSAVIRGIRGEKFADQRQKRAMRERFRENFPASLMYGNLWCAATVVEGALITLGLLFAMLLWDDNAISIGMVYLIYSYSNMVLDPLQDFRNDMGSIQSARAGIRRTQDLLDMQTEPSLGSALMDMAAPQIEIRNLHFSHGDGPEILKGIDITVRAGERVGIMGRTGCGKSTLLGILAGLSTYDSGSIIIGRHELRDIDKHDLRAHVAFAAQKVQIIHGTLRDNIALFNNGYSDMDIMNAISALDLNDWFAEHDMGLDKRLVLGEGSLSSGEAQLISLIRLALRHPSVVLLDEVTSALDPMSEKRMVKAIGKLCEKCTVIAIAHRIEALAWMDRVLHMENGVITSAKDGKAV